MYVGGETSNWDVESKKKENQPNPLHFFSYICIFKLKIQLPFGAREEKKNHHADKRVWGIAECTMAQYSIACHINGKFWQHIFTQRIFRWKIDEINLYSFRQYNNNIIRRNSIHMIYQPHWAKFNTFWPNTN